MTGEFIGWRNSCNVVNGRSKISKADKLVNNRSWFYPAGPINNKRHMRAEVVMVSSTAGQPCSKNAGHNDHRVFERFSFAQSREGDGYTSVKQTDFLVVSLNVAANHLCVWQVLWDLQIVAGQ